MFTPFYRAWIDESNAFIDDTDTHIENSVTLNVFNSGLNKVALEYKLPIMETYKEMGINVINRLYYFGVIDGAHHNQIGREYIAKENCQQIIKCILIIIMATSWCLLTGMERGYEV